MNQQNLKLMICRTHYLHRLPALIHWFICSANVSLRDIQTVRISSRTPVTALWNQRHQEQL